MDLGWFVPRFPLRQLPAMLGLAALGAVAASCYGIVHDQITYSLAPEYFTRLKFHQFGWANLGLPSHVFVGQIGLLASWWVGLIGGWLVARAGAAELPTALRWAWVARAFSIVAIITIVSGLVGWLWGTIVVSSDELAAWQIARTSLGVRDLPAFVVVAYIHNATYVGAAIGIVLAILDVRRRNRASPQAS